jgi:MFS family permease
MSSDSKAISDTKVKPAKGWRRESPGWFNRNVFGFGLTSFLGDFSYEMATAVLPQFMQAIGASVMSLGFIEGIADALSSFTKLWSGFHSDRIGHRKTWTAGGYALTGVSTGIFAFALGWPLILAGRVTGWLGRGIRGPLRDAMLADSVSAEDRGKAFGFHRANDTAGAVVGPLAAFGLLSLAQSHPGVLKGIVGWLPMLPGANEWPYRAIFLLTVIPGVLAFLSIVLLVREKRRQPNHSMRFLRTLRELPGGFRSFLTAAGLFGMADFAPTLMLLRATTVLEPTLGIFAAAKVTTLLFLFRNVVYSAASFPIGALSVSFNRPRYLAVGYGIAVVTFLGFAFVVPSVWWFVLLFGLAGLFFAWEDTMEGVIVGDYVGNEVAGTAYGVLGVVNGLGDFVSSVAVGLLWTLIGPGAGFIYAGAVGLAGTIMMALVKRPS